MGFFPPSFRFKRLLYLMVPVVVELTFFENFNHAGLLGPDVKKLKRQLDVANFARLLKRREISGTKTRSAPSLPQ
ncbi:MAG: hypothetical protein WCF90_11340 [Methanomicrobiales archaeon]